MSLDRRYRQGAGSNPAQPSYEVENMIVGFTGSRWGMTTPQYITVKKLLIEWNTTEGHHGDCVGADREFHNLCEELKIRTVIHPPDNPSYRAFCKGDVILEEKPYLERNHDIVNNSSRMIATPATEKEILRSGTWATVRYTRKIKKYLVVVAPNGTEKFKYFLT